LVKNLQQNKIIIFFLKKKEREEKKAFKKSVISALKSSGHGELASELDF
jgi:hypothetical protein